MQKRPNNGSLSAFIPELPEEDHSAEDEWDWAKMPEYAPPKKDESLAIIVHFETWKDVEKFSKLVKCPITKATKWITYPEKHIQKNSKQPQ